MTVDPSLSLTCFFGFVFLILNGFTVQSKSHNQGSSLYLLQKWNQTLKFMHGEEDNNNADNNNAATPVITIPWLFSTKKKTQQS